MKILLAEDDPVARRRLEAMLVKWGYEVVVACDGTEAWLALRHADAPRLVIADWVMPGMSGIDLCRKLRATPSRTYTYLILLTAKGDKEDIITGLDSGADDYLVKPFDPGEFRARLKAGERTLSLQLELHQRIDDLELLLRRHHLLGDVFRKQAVSAQWAPPTKPAAAGAKPVAADVKPGAADVKPAAAGGLGATPKPVLEVNNILIRVFEQMGLGSAQPIDPSTISGAETWEFTAWSGLILRQTAKWLDLKVEMDRASAEALFRAALGSPGESNENLLDAVGETLHMIQGHFKAAFDEGGIQVIMPIIPKAILRKDLPPLPPPGTGYRQYGYSIPGIVVVVTLMFSPAPVVKKSPDSIKCLDILAEPVQSPRQKEAALLNRGVVLSDHYIEKIRELACSMEGDRSIFVVEPSPLVKALNSR